MSLIDLVLLLRWIEGGTAVICGLYYQFTLLFSPPDLRKGRRRAFTVKIGWLLISLGVDSLISAKIGGPVSYLSAGGSPEPVIAVLISRTLTILFILLLVWSSWRTWQAGSRT